jgi:hypothetical protein
VGEWECGCWGVGGVGVIITWMESEWEGGRVVVAVCWWGFGLDGEDEGVGGGLLFVGCAHVFFRSSFVRLLCRC